MNFDFKIWEKKEEEANIEQHRDLLANVSPILYPLNDFKSGFLNFANNMQPLSIRKISPTEIEIEWNSAHKGRFTLMQLRDLCPCAGCQGEDILLYHLPPPPKTNSPGQYVLNKIEQVGSYAIQLTWGDGHDAGIYTWEYLMNVCPCGECSDKKRDKNKEN